MPGAGAVPTSSKPTGLTTANARQVYPRVAAEVFVLPKSSASCLFQKSVGVIPLDARSCHARHSQLRQYRPAEFSLPRRRPNVDTLACPNQRA